MNRIKRRRKDEREKVGRSENTENVQHHKNDARARWNRRYKEEEVMSKAKSAGEETVGRKLEITRKR